MNILTLFLTIPYFLVVSECCMRMVPPDDVYIPSTLAPEESTLAPGEITMAPGSVSTPETSEETEAPEVTMMTTIAMESTTEEVCPTSTTKCPDLTTVVEAPMMVEVVDGCVVLSCPVGTLPYGTGSFDGSELTDVAIPGVAKFAIRAPLSSDDLNGITINDYYGLLCENNKLTASKYPRGIFIGFSLVGDDGSLNGKKGPIATLYATDGSNRMAQCDDIL
ncbi:DUF281 domain-containing protein [Caenorhabditis elegans]|uniref:DUF281 domain-containing protein n=1 Tax=Caenorhabditis elegans TaxID=6239 RepID=O76598_CAEEL|nr:DUF281 domain-containing protein [Caenorhabditis elegans]CCD69612.1 DUF281 domain-containing protein [Caenorhabditis elegans]|eukprot:NP_494267.2 Uncharacterized protein CELE_F16G10.14 [Caenorhabditis elegans]